MGRLSLPQLQNILHSNFPVDVAEGEVSLMLSPYDNPIPTRLLAPMQIV
jgi:hypothetical protein